MHLLQTHETDWDPKNTRVSLNICTEACIVPTDADSARLTFGHVVVLDDFFTEEMRKEIFESVNRPGWEDWQPPSTIKWQKATCDQAETPPTWGLKDAHLRELLTNPCWAMIEVQSRLAKLYPEVQIFDQMRFQIGSQKMTYTSLTEQSVSSVSDIKNQAGWLSLILYEIACHMHVLDVGINPRGQIQGHLQAHGSCVFSQVSICHMPSEEIQSNQMTKVSERDVEGTDEDVTVNGYYCDKFVANAAVHGDSFSWHVDADPWTFDEESEWAKKRGIYFNGEPGKPLFVSLLLYLNADWEREWDAETLFLDSHTETGFFVRPKNGRVVLMDQDILHRLSSPSVSADRPRYSLVWKLVFVPKNKNQTLEIPRHEWGQPTYFGSAARAKAVQDYLF